MREREDGNRLPFSSSWFLLLLSSVYSVADRICKNAVWLLSKLGVVAVIYFGDIGCNGGILKARGMRDNFLGLWSSQDGSNFVVK